MVGDRSSYAPMDARTPSVSDVCCANQSVSALCCEDLSRELPKPTVGTLRSTITFWRRAKEDDEIHTERETTKMKILADISKPSPEATVHSMSSMRQKLDTWTNLVMGLLSFVLLAVNTYSVTKAFLLSFGQEVTFSHRRGFHSSLTSEGLTICDDTGDCKTYEVSRVRAYQVSCALDFFLVIPMAIAYLFCVLLFLIGFQKLAADRPGFFIYAPRFAKGFSSLVFLSLMSFKPYMQWVFYNEGQLWTEMFLCSLCPSRKFRKPGKSNTGNLVSHLVFFIITLLLVGVGFQVMLVKLTAIHFAITEDFRNWGFWMWLDVLGFLNQLASAFSIWSHDTGRLLLYHFAGADEVFSPKECLTIVGFFSAIVEKLSNRIPSIRCILIFSALDADDLQRCLLSTGGERKVELAADRREKLLSDIYTSDEAGIFEDELKEVLEEVENGYQGRASTLLQAATQKRIQYLEGHRDLLLAEAKAGQSIAPKSQLLVLAGQVQCLIERLQVVQDTNLEDEDDSDVEDDEDDEDDNDY